jgi:hypothetical protein
MGNGPASVPGGRHPLAWAGSAAVAQVMAILAGILAMAGGIEDFRILREPGLSYAWTDQPANVWVAGAGLLVAVVALTLCGRARWLRYPLIILWVCELASSTAFTGLVLLFSPSAIVPPALAWLAVGDAAVLISLVALVLSPLRPPGKPSRRPIKGPCRGESL